MTSTTTVHEDSPSGHSRLTAGRTLSEDPDTSMVTSARLHLVSEHMVMDALHMDAADAAALHTDLHMHHEFDHPITDQRFRPGRILALLTVADELSGDDVEDDPDDDEPIEQDRPETDDEPDQPDEQAEGEEREDQDEDEEDPDEDDPAPAQDDPAKVAAFRSCDADEQHWVFEDEGTEESLIEDLDDTPVNVPKMPVQMPAQSAPREIGVDGNLHEIPRAYRFASADFTPDEPEGKRRANPILALWAR
jgi:hypothetical protein